MSLLDEIKRDRKILASHEPVGVVLEAFNRRSARAPDMEKALLAAEELAHTLDADMGRLAFSPATIKALNAFRAATE